MNEQRRPLAGTGVEEVIAATASSIARIGQVSREIGWEAAMTAMRIGGEDMARAARSFWRHPRYVELQKRREPNHDPCGLRSCRGSCSRCVHAEAWRRRGGRPYLGIEAEQTRMTSSRASCSPSSRAS